MHSVWNVILEEILEKKKLFGLMKTFLPRKIFFMAEII